MSRVVVEESGREMRLWKEAVREIFSKAPEILGERLAISSGTGDDLSIIWWSISAIKPYVVLRIGRWVWWGENHVDVATIERNHCRVHLSEPKLEPLVKEVLDRLEGNLGEMMTITTAYKQ